jgi:hypothetical protein
LARTLLADAGFGVAAAGGGGSSVSTGVSTTVGGGLARGFIGAPLRASDRWYAMPTPMAIPKPAAALNSFDL